jgi:hypothetical protein
MDVPVDSVMGPYIDREAFALQSRRTFFPQGQAVVEDPHHNVQLELSRLVLKPLKQVPGHRIDFFGGSKCPVWAAIVDDAEPNFVVGFLFTAGLTLSTIVGALGYGAFITGTKLYGRYGPLGIGRF